MKYSTMYTLLLALVAVVVAVVLLIVLPGIPDRAQAAPALEPVSIGELCMVDGRPSLVSTSATDSVVYVTYLNKDGELVIDWYVYSMFGNTPTRYRLKAAQGVCPPPGKQ